MILPQALYLCCILVSQSSHLSGDLPVCSYSWNSFKVALIICQTKTCFDAAVESTTSGNRCWLTGINETETTLIAAMTPGHAQCCRSAALFCAARTRSRPRPVCPVSLSLLSVSTSVSLSLFLTKRFSARIESERHKKAFQILRVSVSAERSGGEETPGGSEELTVDSPSALNLKHSH